MSAAAAWLRDVEFPLTLRAESGVERRLRDRVREWLRSSRAVVAWAKVDLTREKFALDMAETIRSLLNLRFEVGNFGLQALDRHSHRYLSPSSEEAPSVPEESARYALIW